MNHVTNLGCLNSSGSALTEATLYTGSALTTLYTGTTLYTHYIQGPRQCLRQTLKMGLPAGIRSLHSIFLVHFFFTKYINFPLKTPDMT